MGLAAIGAAIVFGGCAQNLTHPPVYRGQYYAFDVYPYGYNGYPAFPYYGAPFGYGGPAFAKVGERIVAPSGKLDAGGYLPLSARDTALAAVVMIARFSVAQVSLAKAMPEYNLEGSVGSRDSKGRCRGAARDTIEAGLN